MLTEKNVILIALLFTLGACSSSDPAVSPDPMDSTPAQSDSPTGSGEDDGTPSSDMPATDTPATDTPATDNPDTAASAFSALAGIWDSSEVSPKPFTEYRRIFTDGKLEILDYQGDSSNGAGAQNCFEIASYTLSPIEGETDLYLQTFQGPLSSGFSGESIRFLQVNDNTLVVAEPRHEGETLGEPNDLIKDPDGNVQLVGIQLFPRLVGVDPEFNECI